MAPEGVTPQGHSVLTHDQLLSLLHYSPETGDFTWKTRAAICLTVGDAAGRKTSRTYLQIKIGYRAYLNHRLAWFYVHGVWPVGPIDHVNGDKMDNRIANLRSVTHSLNQINRRSQNHLNKHGLAGVIEKRGRFQARVIVGRRQIYLGIFDTPEQANARYMQAKEAMLDGRAVWNSDLRSKLTTLEEMTATRAVAQ